MRAQTRVIIPSTLVVLNVALGVAAVAPALVFIRQAACAITVAVKTETAVKAFL